MSTTEEFTSRPRWGVIALLGGVLPLALCATLFVTVLVGLGLAMPTDSGGSGYPNAGIPVAISVGVAVAVALLVATGWGLHRLGARWPAAVVPLGLVLTLAGPAGLLSVTQHPGTGLTLGVLAIWGAVCFSGVARVTHAAGRRHDLHAEADRLL